MPPAIAYVNWEAREVAKKYAIKESNIDPEKKVTSTWGFWFQPRLDTLLMYREDDQASVYRYQDHVFSKTMLKELESKARDTAICSELINPFSSLHMDWEFQPGMQYAPDSGWNDPLIILEVITIHAKKADVLAAQLFGKLADEPIQLVDPLEGEGQIGEAQIEEYRKLCYHSQVLQSSGTTMFFASNAGDEIRAKIFRREVRIWMHECKARELWPKWKKAKAQGFFGIPRPETIWTAPAGPALDMLDEGTLTAGTLDGSINVVKFGINEMHPWVRENLAGTSFQPRLMFRWCGEACWTRQVGGQ